MIVFEGHVDMAPFPCQRPRFGSGVTYNKPEYSRKKRTLHIELRALMLKKKLKLFDGPLMVAVDFLVKKAKKTAPHLKKYPCKTPDIDNYLKAFLDSANGSVYEDDCQIISVNAIKCYTESNERIVFRIESLS